MVTSYLRSLRPGLPRDVYVLQSGLVLNAFGNGTGNPFLWIYLHDVRGLPLAVAGAAGSTSAAFGLLGAFVAGSVADRRGARGTMLAGLAVSAIGWSLFPLVRESWQALALASLTGTGIGVWLTTQSALLGLIVPRGLRHAAFAQQRVAANLGLGLGGFAGGLIVTTAHPGTFTVLFLLNSGTFLAYGLFVARLRVPARVATPDRGYRGVFGDRAFVRLLALNFVFVTVMAVLLNSAFPVFAKGEAGAAERTIGLVLLLNALIIVGAQLPTAKAVEGRRRVRCLGLMCVVLGTGWGLVAVAGVTDAVALLFVCVAIVSLGECIYDSVYGPLVVDLAPEDGLGRYLAASALTWQLAFIVVPVTSGVVLGVAPFALWPAVAALALVAAVATLRFERWLPEDVRRTPRRGPAAQEKIPARARSA